MNEEIETCYNCEYHNDCITGKKTKCEFKKRRYEHKDNELEK